MPDLLKQSIFNKIKYKKNVLIAASIKHLINPFIYLEFKKSPSNLNCCFVLLLSVV